MPACLRQGFRGCYSEGTPPSEAATKLSSQITVLSSQSCPLVEYQLEASAEVLVPIKALGIKEKKKQKNLKKASRVFMGSRDCITVLEREA